MVTQRLTGRQYDMLESGIFYAGNLVNRYGDNRTLNALIAAQYVIEIYHDNAHGFDFLVTALGVEMLIKTSLLMSLSADKQITHIGRIMDKYRENGQRRESKE